MRPASTTAPTTDCSTARDSNSRQEYRERARSKYDIRNPPTIKKPKVTQRVPKVSHSQTPIKNQSIRASIKGPFSQTSIALKLSAKVPMVVRKAKDRPRFTFERLCLAAGVRKQTVAGPSPPGYVPPINCSSLRSNPQHQPHSHSSRRNTPGRRRRHAKR